MRNVTLTHFRLAPWNKGLLVSFSLLGMPVLAQVANDNDSDNTFLDVITVVGKNTSNIDTKHDVTGLGTIEKNDFVLQEAQVENIRDLTRYDPGISVNEAGGRGTSRGFAIRGVEKERVAINVDGMSSAPILRRDDRNSGSSPSRSSASINEVEYENLKLVDIRKGSSSSESGSGALGGAVSMTTKDAADFFFDDDSTFAGRVKVGYTSKDKRKLVSAAVAARHDGWEGFVQYTGREGHEIRAHEDLYKNSYEIKDPYIPGGSHHFSAEDVSGPKRRTPNPLDYDSQSVLSKVGYHFDDVHYAGIVLEHTVQNYDRRDMYVPNYHNNDDQNRLFTPTDRVMAYTPTRHYFDDHNNTRVGFEYKYRAPDTEGWVDAANAHLDWRKLEIGTDTRTLNCAPWPNVDPNCWPRENKASAGQLGKKTYSELSEKDIRFDVDALKTLNFANTEHQLRLHAGVIGSRYKVDDTEHRLYVQTLLNTQTNNQELDVSRDDGFGSTDTIRGHNIFFGLSDKMTLSDQLEANVSLRYDHHKFSANPNAVQKSRGMIFTGSSFNNFSWDAGIAYRPIEGWTLAYRASSGFRVPSVVEQIGPYFNTTHLLQGGTQGPLKAEKSFNQEIGIEYSSAPIKASASYFITRYSDIIDMVSLKDNSYPVYNNAQNFTTHGFDVKASVMPHAFWDKVPDGLELFGNVGMTKAKKISPLSDDITVGSTYSFDAIQPLRAVYGVNYHDPDEKWGAGLTNTWSKAKDPDELITNTVQGGLHTSGNSRFANARSKDWWTTDLTGYYNITDDITVRAGVYNLLNHRYITWESVRENSFGLEARVGTPHYTVAPGRNYLVNFEIRL